MILADSSIWIAYFNGQMNWQSDLLDELLQTKPVIMGDLLRAVGCLSKLIIASVKINTF